MSTKPDALYERFVVEGVSPKDLKRAHLMAYFEALGVPKTASANLVRLLTISRTTSGTLALLLKGQIPSDMPTRVDYAGCEVSHEQYRERVLGLLSQDEVTDRDFI